jgi:hypothetical protein
VKRPNRRGQGGNPKPQDQPQQLPPPPRLLPESELPAIIEPPLRDLVTFPGHGTVEEWQPFESGPVPAEDQLLPEIVQRAQTVAMAHKEVQGLLDGKKYIPVGASLIETEDKSARPNRQVLFVFYDYTDNLALEVLLDRNAEKVARVTRAPYQPPPTSEEIDQAITLARQDNRLAGKLTENLEGTAILVSPADPDHPQSSHRQFDVRFGYPDERLPRYSALVDLSTQTVLETGALQAEGGMR